MRSGIRRAATESPFFAGFLDFHGCERHPLFKLLHKIASPTHWGALSRMLFFMRVGCTPCQPRLQVLCFPPSQTLTGMHSRMPSCCCGHTTASHARVCHHTRSSLLYVALPARCMCMLQLCYPTSSAVGAKLQSALNACGQQAKCLKITYTHT